MNGSSRTPRSRGLAAALAVSGLAVALVSISCAKEVEKETSAPTVDTEAIAQELTRLDDEWSAAAGRKDVEAVASYYADDAIAYPPNAPVAVGRSTAREVWAAYLADSTFSISWKTTHAGASESGDMGYTSGTYEDSYVGPDGSRIDETGKYLCVWEKQADGTWKAIHDMWNTDS